MSNHGDSAGGEASRTALLQTRLDLLAKTVKLGVTIDSATAAVKAVEEPLHKADKGIVDALIQPLFGIQQSMSLLNEHMKEMIQATVEQSGQEKVGHVYKELLEQRDVRIAELKSENERLNNQVGRITADLDSEKNKSALLADLRTLMDDVSSIKTVVTKIPMSTGLSDNFNVLSTLVKDFETTTVASLVKVSNIVSQTSYTVGVVRDQLMPMDDNRKARTSVLQMVRSLRDLHHDFGDAPSGSMLHQIRGALHLQDSTNSPALPIINATTRAILSRVNDGIAQNAQDSRKRKEADRDSRLILQDTSKKPAPAGKEGGLRQQVKRMIQGPKKPRGIHLDQGANDLRKYCSEVIKICHDNGDRYTNDELRAVLPDECHHWIKDEKPEAFWSLVRANAKRNCTENGRGFLFTCVAEDTRKKPDSDTMKFGQDEYDISCRSCRESQGRAVGKGKRCCLVALDNDATRLYRKFTDRAALNAVTGGGVGDDGGDDDEDGEDGDDEDDDRGDARDNDEMDGDDHRGRNDESDDDSDYDGRPGPSNQGRRSQVSHVEDRASDDEVLEDAPPHRGFLRGSTYAQAGPSTSATANIATDSVVSLKKTQTAPARGHSSGSDAPAGARTVSRMSSISQLIGAKFPLRGFRGPSHN